MQNPEGVGIGQFFAVRRLLRLVPSNALFKPLSLIGDMGD